MPDTMQAKLIRAAALKAVEARDDYSAKFTARLTQTLKDAQQSVSKAIMGYSNLGSLPDNKLAALNGLEALNAQIADVMAKMTREHTLAFRTGTTDAFKAGVYSSIREFSDAQLPGYRDLKGGTLDRLTTDAFEIIDTDALDFMTEYNLVLAGDVDREVVDGIKRTVMGGIATGKSPSEIVSDMGEVIPDKESFRKAGNKVWSKAQYRMETIARSEVIRAHNMGSLKFKQRVGVQKLEWLAVGDERMCPVCGVLDGKVYMIDKFPQQPAHPNCRCTHVVAWPMSICGEYAAP